jgi:tetratricopeptide (TPR) repeat protein
MPKREHQIEEAEKLAARGKIDAAIKEYRHIIDQSPNDTNLLNRLGDLLVSAERIPEAVELYNRVAEHFGKDGFFLKAIAILKKVNRLDPRQTETYEHLADYYFKQGLVIEGRQQLVTLVDWFTRTNNASEALRVARRLVDLEPTNLQARARLVELLSHHGDVTTVTKEISTLGQVLLSRSMFDEALKLYYRGLDLRPPDGDFVAPCIDQLIASGRHPQAEELATRALAICPQGVNLRRAAARVAFEVGNLARAREILEGILARASDNTDVAQLYGDVMLRSGDITEAKALLLPVVERLGQAGDHERATALMSRLLKAAPSDIDMLEHARIIFDRHADSEVVLNVESALADAYLRTGRRDEAGAIYRELALRYPADPTFTQRLEELGITLPPPPKAEPPAATAAAGKPAGRQAQLEYEFVDVALPPESPADTAPVYEVPEDVSEAPVPFASPPPAPPRLEPAAGQAPPLGAPTTETRAVTSTERGAARELFSEAAVFAKYGLKERAAAHLRRVIEIEPSHAQARDLLTSLGEGAAAAAPPPRPAPAKPRVQAALDVNLPVPDMALPWPPTPAPSFSSGGEFIALGPDSSSLPFGMKSGPGKGAHATDDVEVLDAPLQVVEMGEALTGPDEAQLHELDFLIQQGLLEDAGRMLRKLGEMFAGHPELAARRALLEQRGWQEGSAEASAAELFGEEEQFFDLAAELEKDLADEEIVTEATGAGKSEEVSIDQLFKEFQRGVAEQVQPDDYETHFNLGLAFREMGLLDEAIAEFQVATQSANHLIEAASMIGTCYLDKGLPEQAAEWFGRALMAPALPPETAVGLRYELACAQETSGNITGAIANLNEVVALNPGYRDAKKRLAKLRPS